MAQATQLSKKLNFKEIYAISKKTIDELPNNANVDFRIEQVVFDKKTKTWNCVISFLAENKSYDADSRPFGVLFTKNEKYERIFKTLIINENNDVEGIYIYKNDNN